MAEILQADLDTLHKLAGTLTDHANAIGNIQLTAAITMPDSPVQAAADQIHDAVLKAYGIIGDDIRGLADGSSSAAKTYEELDGAYASVLFQYISGKQAL